MRLSGLAWQWRLAPAPTRRRRYGVKRLVHVEIYEDVHDAIAREKQLKKWNRAWKLRLIETDNPSWRELWPDVVE